MQFITIDPITKLATYQSQNITIKEFHLKDIMLKTDTRPFFMFAQGNSGKSVISIDMFLKAMESEQFNQFIYITGSYNGKGNDYLRKKVLKCCCFQPKTAVELIGYLQKVMTFLLEENSKLPKQEQIIQFIKTQICPKQQKYQISLQQIQQSLTTKYQTFKSKMQSIDLVQVVFNNSITIQKIFNDIYKQMDFDNFILQLDNYNEQINLAISAEQTIQIIYQKEETTKQNALYSFTTKAHKEYKQYKEEELQSYMQILQSEYQNLQQSVESKQKILEYFQNQDNLQTIPEYIKHICLYVQTPIRACVIVDDVSPLLQQAEKCSEELPDGRKCSAVYEELLSTMLTQGRHVANMFISVHAPSYIPSSSRNQIASSWMSNYQIFNKDDKTEIMTIIKNVHKYNEDNKPVRYCLVVYKESSESPDGKSKYCLMKASYNPSTVFDTKSYQNNKYFKILAEDQKNNKYEDDEIKPETKQTSSSSDDSDS